MNGNTGNWGDANSQAASRCTASCGDGDAAFSFVFPSAQRYLCSIAAVERCAILHGRVHNDMYSAGAWNGKI